MCVHAFLWIKQARITVLPTEVSAAVQGRTLAQQCDPFSSDVSIGTLEREMALTPTSQASNSVANAFVVRAEILALSDAVVGAFMLRSTDGTARTLH